MAVRAAGEQQPGCLAEAKCGFGIHGRGVGGATDAVCAEQPSGRGHASFILAARRGGRRPVI
jgi:hypothetical protein